MPVYCTKHMDRQAIGKCFRCEKPYCLDCLDMESGRPICSDCKSQNTAPAEAPAPSVKPQLKFNVMPTPVISTPPPTPPAASKAGTQISLDDLFAAPKKVAPPAPVAAQKAPVEDPLGLFKEGAAKPPLPKLEVPPPDLPKNEPFKIGSTPVAPPTVHREPVKTEAHSFSPGTVTFKDLHAPRNKMLMMLAGLLLKPLQERVHAIAHKLKVAAYLVAVFLLLILAGTVFWITKKVAPPPVEIVEKVPLIQIVPIQTSQAGDMDITAFADLQNQLGPLNFNQLIQMTVPQIPTPNFFDVGMKSEVSMYSEILKMPDQVAPHLAFVTVFTNGVWYSTNGWTGTEQSLENLVSEFYPSATAEQLYNQHAQGVEKLVKEKGWEPQKTSLNRYMAALSDHLRWYITLKNIPAYQADFSSWH